MYKQILYRRVQFQAVETWCERFHEYVCLKFYSKLKSNSTETLSNNAAENIDPSPNCIHFQFNA